MNGSAERSEGLRADKLSWLGAGLRLRQTKAKARWTPWLDAIYGTDVS